MSLRYVSLKIISILFLNMQCAKVSYFLQAHKHLKQIIFLIGRHIKKMDNFAARKQKDVNGCR